MIPIILLYRWDGGDCISIAKEEVLRTAVMARIIAIEEVLVAEGKTTRAELKRKATAQVEQTSIDEEVKEKIINYL